MSKASYLGSEALPYAVAVVYFCFSQRAGARLGILYAVSHWLLIAAKWGLHLPRPGWLDSNIKVLTGTGSFGMPSGHVLSAAVVWPLMSEALRSKWAMGAAVVCVLLVSYSRVYLGAHFVSDVVAAWVLAAAILWAGRRFGGWLQLEEQERGAHASGVSFAASRRKLRIIQLFRRWSCGNREGRVGGGTPPTAREPRALPGTHSVRERSVVGGVGIFAMLAVLMIVTGLLARDYGLNAVRSEPWAHFVVNEKSATGLFKAAGAFLGFGCGWVMARRWARFATTNIPWWRRIVACAYAYLGFWLIPELADFLPSHRGEMAKCAAGFGIEVLKGWWLFFIAPWVLLKIGILVPDDADLGVLEHRERTEGLVFNHE